MLGLGNLISGIATMVANVLIGLAGLALVAGLWMTLRGLRGHRVGDAPHCRKCGFNLSGSPADAAGCPECGHDLTKPKSTRSGERHRRPITLAAGVAVLLLAFSFAGFETARRTSYPTLVPHLPDFYLLWIYEADPLARDELLARLRAGQLSRGEVDDLTATALNIQGDPAVPWDKAWGRMIEQAWVKGQLSQARAERYLTQAVELRCNIRREVQVGRDLYLSGDGRIDRIGDAHLHVSYAWDEIWVDGAPVLGSRQTRGGRFFTHATGRSAVATHATVKAAAEQSGIARLVAQATLDVRMNLAQAPSPMRLNGMTVQTSPQTITVVKHPTGRYVMNDTVNERLRASATVRMVEEARRSERFLMIAIENIPLNLDWQYWDVYIRGSGAWRKASTQWRRTGTTDRAASGQTRVLHLGGYWRVWLKPGEIEQDLGESPDHLDVLVRTDVVHAETTTDSGASIWLGQLYFSDVHLSAQPVIIADRNLLGRNSNPNYETIVSAVLVPMTVEDGALPPTVGKVSNVKRTSEQSSPGQMGTHHGQE